MAMLLPRSADGERMLLFTLNGKKMAVMLDPNFLFLDREGNGAWKGVHIPRVCIELDPASILDTRGNFPPLGAMTRHDNFLSINGRHGHGYATTAMPLLDNLPPCTEGHAASFLRWQIVLGEGIEKQVLHQVDVTPKS